MGGGRSRPARQEHSADDEGPAMAKRMLGKSLEIEAQILQALSPQELRTTRAALEKIARRLTEV